ATPAAAKHGHHPRHKAMPEQVQYSPGFETPMMAGIPGEQTVQPSRRTRRQLQHPAADSMAMSGPTGFGGGGLVSEARRYLGGNPTGRSSLWCARFMSMVLKRTGHHGTGSDMASSFARYGRHVSGPQVGAIAVMGRRGG